MFLSFPADLIPEFNCSSLGDLIICAPIVEEQATQYNKIILAHWAHMVIHGVLHLLGYDHNTDKEATIMEDREIKNINNSWLSITI